MVSIGVCSVSAASTKTYDLYDSTFTVIQGASQFTSNSWLWTSSATLLFPRLSLTKADMSTDLIVRVTNDNIQLDSGSTYSFSYWVEVYGADSFSSEFLPNKIQLRCAGVTVTSSSRVLQTSGDLRYTFNFTDFKVENYNGPFTFDIIIPWLDGPSGSSETSFPYSLRFSTFRQLNLTITDQADKILGGLNSTFGENYDQPDGSAQEDYENAESQLVGGVTSDLAGIENNWNDIGGFLGEYQGAFYGIGEFIGKLTSIPILKNILLFSISVGVFGLLLGVVSVASRNRGS